jgi:hypothetical protein
VGSSTRDATVAGLLPRGHGDAALRMSGSVFGDAGILFTVAV